MTRKPRLNWEWLTVTPAERDLARRRTDFLVDHIGSTLTIGDMLANAYLQGVIDAAETMVMIEDRKTQIAPAAS